MILQALSEYYARLIAAGENIVRPGYSRQKIAFCVDLADDGAHPQIRDMRRREGVKTFPLMQTVLGGAKPSGSGLNPCTLWDNASYMLGYKMDDPKPERTRQSFEAFRECHLAVEDDVNDPEYSAVCRFLEAWDPSRVEEFPILMELSTGFGVFRVGLATHFVHESPGVIAWWEKRLSESNEQGGRLMQCMVNGNTSPIARIHEPKIKGVRDTQSSGALLVSFNFPATESYGKIQSFTAPVSEEAAFRYCVALNGLLDRLSTQRVQIADATTVFWTDRPSPAESYFTGLLNPGDVEDESLKVQLASILTAASKGSFPAELGEPETRCYVLGLSPNAARISVRFWWTGALVELTERIGRHFQDLSIVRPVGMPEHPSLWQLLRETARDPKDIPPMLSGGIMRAILQGIDYPSAFLHALLRRTRADQQMPPNRAAAIKACLNRYCRLHQHASPLNTEIAMSLDHNRTESAYQLGRLFAALEKTQEDAMGRSVNATIKDRFFGAASATPAAVFPRLIRMNQHHLNKIDAAGIRINHEKRIQEIVGRLDSFPSHLPIADQGLFAIGYYHQRQDFFTKKESANQEDTP